MFSKSSKGSAKSALASKPATEKQAPPSIVSTDLRIIGDLSSEGEVQIDGTVNGDIKTSSLLIGKTAVIKGEIVADAVRILGQVNGQIKARKVVLSKTAHVVGDILHEDLSIETGAFLEGHCKRMAETKEDAAESRVNVVVKDGPKGSSPAATKPGAVSGVGGKVAGAKKAG